MDPWGGTKRGLLIPRRGSLSLPSGSHLGESALAPVPLWPSYTFFAWVWPLAPLCIFVAGLHLSSSFFFLVVLCCWSRRGRSGAHVAFAYRLVEFCVAGLSASLLTADVVLLASDAGPGVAFWLPCGPSWRPMCFRNLLIVNIPCRVSLFLAPVWSPCGPCVFLL